MSIHILTQNLEVKKRLGAFLDDMGKEYVFHDTLPTLQKKLSRLKKTDAVFYDLQLEELIWAFEPIYLGSRKTHMVVFEPSETNTVSYTPMGNEHLLILSKDDARTKTRLVSLLHELTKLSAPRKKAKKKAKKTTVAQKKTASKATKKKTTSTPAAQVPTHTPSAQQTTRYLHARSDVMQSFVSELQDAAGKHKFIMLQGEDGAEFELAARELNFQANGDNNALIVLDAMNLNSQELEKLEEAAMKNKVDQYCYLGLTLELNSQSVEQISVFLKHLKKLKDKDTYLHLILGHEIDSESCYPDNIRPTLEVVHKTSQLFNIPSMADRKDDITLIAHSIFSILRMAHPFLQARTIDNTAIKHLEDHCAELDYSRITRVLRNAMALGNTPKLTESELKNFNDNSPTTQHLIESLADEKFFSSPQ